MALWYLMRSETQSQPMLCINLDTDHLADIGPVRMLGEDPHRAMAYSTLDMRRPVARCLAKIVLVLGTS